MAELDSIDVEPRHLKIVKSVFARHLPYKQVWAYGSRVKWTAGHTSDLDCVVFGATDSEIADAKEAFDESDIPFEVQLLNWDNIPEDFKENIKKGYFILQNKRDWGKFRLGDVVTLHYGKSLPMNKRIDGTVPVYSSAGLTGWHNESIIKSSAVIIGRKGTIGKVYKTNGPFFAIDTSYYILPSLDKYDLNYLFYVLSNLDLEKLNEDSAVPGLNRSTVYSHQLSLPPISEQKAIASVLSSIDDKIDLLHRQNNTLESIAETIFRQWFIEETDDSWEEGVLGDAIQLFDSKRIPISKIQRDKMKDGNLFPYYGAATIMDYINNYIFDGEYILLGEDGTVRTNEGYPILQYATGKFWVNNHVHVIQAKSPYNNFFLWCYLSKKNIDKIVTGAVQPKVNQVNLKSLDFPKFPENLIEKFCFNTADIFSKIKHNQKQIKTLECLRNMLLPKLISGDIRVEYEEVS